MSMKMSFRFIASLSIDYNHRKQNGLWKMNIVSWANIRATSTEFCLDGILQSLCVCVCIEVIYDALPREAGGSNKAEQIELEM